MVRRRRDGNESSRITLAPGMLAVPNVRLVRKIAEGGMGSVWEAEHLSLRTNVAVKFVLDELGESAEAAARFDREATAAARIKSPHVVQTLDHGVTSDGVAYIVMELLEGEDLEARLVRDKKLPLELVAHLITQAAKALEKAHGLGIVHRDIKPSNVYLTDVGGEVFVKVLDFGIAKLSLANAAQMRVTQTGSMIGTPVFMAPEQMLQAKDVGPAADMWSLGVVAYVAATGKLPYDSDTIAGLAMAIERGVFPPATSVAPELPPAIDGWFDHALSKDPAGRFASIREMADQMAKVAGTHVPISMALQTKLPSTPPPNVKVEAERSVADKPEKKDIALSKSLAEPPAPETAALATTLQASPIASATIMGASSEKARQEVRSSTRTLVFAAVAICSLGAGAVLYGVFRSNTEPSTGSATAPVASATESASNRPVIPTRPPPTEPRSAIATSAAPPPESASAVEIESSAPSQSVSAPPKHTGTLPRVPPPPARPPVSAAPKASASVSAGPAPSASAPKPSASAPPPPAPSVSAKAAPKAPSAKPPP